METVVGLGLMAWVIAISIVGFCLFISPLMIWKHTKATSKKIDKLIELIKENRTP